MVEKAEVVRNAVTLKLVDVTEVLSAVSYTLALQSGILQPVVGIVVVIVTVVVVQVQLAHQCCCRRSRHCHHCICYGPLLPLPQPLLLSPAPPLMVMSLRRCEPRGPPCSHPPSARAACTAP